MPIFTVFVLNEHKSPDIEQNIKTYIGISSGTAICVFHCLCDDFPCLFCLFVCLCFLLQMNLNLIFPPKNLRIKETTSDLSCVRATLFFIFCRLNSKFRFFLLLLLLLLLLLNCSCCCFFYIALQKIYRNKQKLL